MIQLSILFLIFASDVVSPHKNESITNNHRTMRKLLLLILTLFIANLAVMADRVSEAEALQKAQQFMQSKQFMQKNLRRAPSAGAVDNSYYVFNVEDCQGFVIVAADDCMPDILGYSDKGHFDLSKAPDNVKWLMDYYAKIAKSLKDNPTTTTSRRAPIDRPEVQPLIKTTWDQGNPYNMHCPEINGYIAPTGCVATAMAQVINYFQWPIKEVRAMGSYTTNSYNAAIPELPARKIGWYNMTDDEIAWLMRYCGQSVTMDYMPNESGARAIDIAGALISVFNYSKTTTFVTRGSYSDTEWEELIYNELNVGRPVIYNGDSGDGQSGHSFILHGYKDGLFCVNWGWSGQCDGYFALTNLSPNEVQHYTENQNAIISIQPASNNDDEAIDAAKEWTIHLDKPGTLASLIPMDEWYGGVNKLTISGELNGDDIYVIRQMAGSAMQTLDMSDARIVAGGRPYLDSYTTENDVVGQNMFFQCRALQTLILPPSIKSYRTGAFTETDLRSFFVPKNVTSIGPGIFSGCRNLGTIEVEEGNPNYYSPSGSNAIIECTTKKLIAGCSGTVIPEGVTTIASYALATNILAVTLPESLTTIEDHAFEGAGLKYLYIPKNIKSIGDGAFSSAGLQGISVESGNTVYDSRNNCNCLIETATNTVLLGSAGSVIPEGIETIGDLAFRSSRIGTITLPQSLKEIGMRAFEDTWLRHMEIPSNVTSIGSWAFGSSHFKVCKVKCQTPPSIDESTFYNMASDVKLIVPNGTKSQYKSAQGWKNFSEILEKSEIQSSRSINVAVAGSLSSLLTEEEKDNTEELTLTGQLNANDLDFIRKEMCGNEQASNRGILRVLDMTNARIENDAIGHEGMAWALTLEEVKLPNTLKSIGWMAFYESGIKGLFIPKSVTELGPDIFYQCGNLASLVVEEGNPVFDSRENCNAIIETATNILRIGCRSTVVPSSVVGLGNSSFSGVNGLTSLDLPDGVRSIGNGAFWADEGLTSVKLSKSVVELGTGPFVGCSNVSSFVIDPENPVYDSRNNCNAIIETATNTLIQGFGTTKIPENVVKLSPQAFQYQNMSYLEIPASVKEIGNSCFLYCNSLTTVVSHVKKPFPVSSSVFSGSNMATAVLHVPFGTKNAYASTAGWGSFPKIVEMDPTDEEIGQHAASVAEVDFGTQYVGLNNQAEVPIYLVGGSIDPITNIDYTITTGSNVYQGHTDIEPLSYMMTAQVLIPFPADATVGEQEKTLTITKVNGLDNEAEEKTASGTLVTVKRKPKFVPLVEEATGTWCGWCPRGAVGLKMLNKTFRDDVVTVAVHSNDPMELPEYWLNSSSFPSCQINRGEFVDPYYGSSDMPFGIKLDVEAAMRQYTIGEIAVNAEWTDASQTAIKVSTTTTFVEDVASSPYQIGYLLLEDKQTGTSSGWNQKNYFSGSTINDSNLNSLVESPSMMQNVKYDHVPVATWKHETGVEGSLPATITSEAPMNYTYTLDISGNTRIQNKARLVVVALLLNKDTKELVNCAKFKFTPDPEPSIVTVKSCRRTYGNANPVFEYTVEGGALEGTPEIICEATATSPVGDYPIVIKQGSVVNEEVTYIDGTLTITKAPLTISVGNYTKRQYEPMPKFTLSYEGFKNNEAAAVLTTQPDVTCEATDDSAPGKYPIVISGAAAQNYDISYVNGTLTVTEPAIYTLTYMVDGEVYKTFSLKQNAPITPEPAPEKEGYTFSGWSNIPETMPAHDVTVTGSFSINSYKLTYTVDGEVYKTYEIEYGATITPEAEPTKEGYTFSGWSEIPETMPAHDVIVTGSFSKGQYKLIYMVDGQTYKTISYDYGDAITPEPAPTKEGYTFSGWSEIPETMPAHDVTVTGTFSINSYKLTYVVDGVEYKSYDIEYGATITPEVEPTKEGYTFSGWSEIPTTMPAHDVTVTGTFTLDTGIEQIMSNVNGDVMIFTIDGKRVDNLKKGMNIIRMSDGTTRRVVVK